MKRTRKEKFLSGPFIVILLYLGLISFVLLCAYAGALQRTQPLTQPLNIYVKK